MVAYTVVALADVDFDNVMIDAHTIRENAYGWGYKIAQGCIPVLCTVISASTISFSVLSRLIKGLVRQFDPEHLVAIGYSIGLLPV